MCKCSRLFLVLLMISAISAGAAVRRTVQFAKGSDSVAINGSVIRGEVDRYLLTARQGQTMTVTISAEEDNAAFTIYRPGWQEKTEDEMTFLEGATMPGAGEGEDAMNWQGILPAYGCYVIEVGGTRGNATYKLLVGIR